MNASPKQTDEQIRAQYSLSGQSGRCGCGAAAPEQKLDVKIPGTVDSYLRGGPFYLCPTCRTTVWRGRWRRSQFHF